MKRERVSFVRPGTLILLTLGLFGCDIATKSTAKAALEGAEAVSVAPAVFRGAVELRYVENDDIAFSALRSLGVSKTPELLVAVASVAIVVMLVAAIRAWRSASRSVRPDGTPSRDGTSLMIAAGFAIILAGALGNVVDRAVHGYVIDFIHVRGWPVFNVADIAVVVGVGLVILAGGRQRTGPPLEAGPPAT
ncbi:MAG TPA: signal peptidase II [Labilithrix sp.]|nr:signal peptidase II [Labilithrix sp.]